MLAHLTNAIFAEPENPVMRAVRGFGLLSPSNGYAFGQSVDITPDNPAMYQKVGPGGALIWQGGVVDGSGYDADFCNKIIMGGAATTDQKFQCSIRGFIGNSPVAMIPPALIPAPPTSVTIPAAIQTLNSPRPIVTRPAMQRCGASGAGEGSGNSTLLALLVFGLGFALMSSGGTNNG